MKMFMITIISSGEYMGCFEGSSPEAAFAAFLRDAGSSPKDDHAPKMEHVIIKEVSAAEG